MAVVVVGFFLTGRTSKAPKTSQEVQTSSPAIAGNGKTVSISAKEFEFNPSTVSVAKGVPVKIILTNDGTAPHNLTIDGLNIATKTISPGESDSITFTPTENGTFSFYCSVGSHKALGMKGTLIVK